MRSVFFFYVQIDEKSLIEIGSLASFHHFKRIPFDLLNVPIVKNLKDDSPLFSLVNPDTVIVFKKKVLKEGGS